MKNEKKIKDAMEQTNARTVPTLNGGSEYEYTIGGQTGYTSDPKTILKDWEDFNKDFRDFQDKSKDIIDLHNESKTIIDYILKG